MVPARRPLRAAVALLAVLLLAGAYVAPAASAAGLRAAKCCAERCAKPRSVAAARPCCPSVGAGDEVGYGAVSPSVGVESPLAAAAIVRLVPQSGSDDFGRFSFTTAPRPAPLLLRTLSLRL
jgi:hypothetical protein